VVGRATNGRFEKGHTKLGGRTAGTLNRIALAQQRAIMEGGLSPIQYLAQVYQDEREPTSIRVDAAKALCGYLYPKVQAQDTDPDAARLSVTVIRFSDLPAGEQILEHDQDPGYGRLPGPEQRDD
jgi:hypothetical protein